MNKTTNSSSYLVNFINTIKEKVRQAINRAEIKQIHWIYDKPGIEPKEIYNTITADVG